MLNEMFDMMESEGAEHPGHQEDHGDFFTTGAIAT
jgi:hypothetical protein